ncbi:MAG TPA: universal stress protein [Acidimicrobiales bacterium]|nr:universal stress protein [Acidimicrobiales bacterium]
MYKAIVVGTDGSPTALSAVRKAAELAALCGATLHVVSAYKPTGAMYVAPDVLPVGLNELLNPQAEAERATADAAEKVAATGVRVETYAVPGDPASALIDVAEAQGGDLIVVGNRGMTTKARFLMGSVPNKVSHHAPCSVLIIKTT